MTKYIFVTGGVVSSLGKGITAKISWKTFKKSWFKCNHPKI